MKTKEEILFIARYHNMRRRCICINHKDYKNYGGRGIKIEWNDYKHFKKDMFKSFIKHLKKYGEKDTTLDRINVNKNYCKNNCVWSTKLEQAQNKRKKIIYIKLKNSTKSIHEWSKLLNIPWNTIYLRYKKGYSSEKILSKNKIYCYHKNRMLK